MATNKASGLTAWNTSRNADALNKKGEKAFWDEWCLRHSDMVARGDTPAKYHKHYLADDKRITDYKLGTFDRYLGAITRAVKKYGSYENAKQAYLKETRYHYIEIAKFCSWAPAGQRAKGVEKKAVAVKTKTWDKVEYIKALTNDLVEAGMPRAMAKNIAEKSANKHFINK